MSEPIPTGGGSSEGADVLSVQVQGAKGDPERLLVLSRPRNGFVEVREFRYGCAQAAPLEYTASAEELYTTFATAHARRRRVSEELYRIRLWLDGHDA